MFKSLDRIRAALARPQQPVAGSYHVFTSDYDVVVEARQLPNVLGPMSVDQLEAHDRAWAAFSGALQGWRTETHLRALDASTRIRKSLNSSQLADTTVTILVDQSGSMRGQGMLLAAASCDVAQDFLRHLGVTVDILGFTTVQWRGGRSRERWLREGRPPQSGRLCDLLHVIYRQPDDIRAATGSHSFKAMLRPDLPKENVDGEAVLWATSRLRSRPETRKLLIVLSDGAPVDDATLAANDLSYLDRHLKEVLRALEEIRDIRTLGIGIGFDSSQYYSRSTVVTKPEDLGEALISALEAAI